ncbi:MAG: bifunctional DNA-formamidopyrimidine glycosylase/DNA-(apurinic or apyrimidinic site) lyase [Bifidobacteriaceae bacterium]|nr:bifunctional DNA-formamidopyrimidine glycosylase/DNA-(apurinic or apyrimidinic site) lyase [Bifidobacteriaceae bacterium]
MPELPEVETVRRGLERLVIGSPIAAVAVLAPASLRGDPASLIGRRFVRAWRRGKVLGLDLDDGRCLVAHLKMTGQMVFRGPRAAGPRAAGPRAVGPPAGGAEAWGAGHPNDSLIGSLPDNSTRVIVEFAGGARLYFNDQRKFGWLALMPQSQVTAIPLLAKMGPEPLDAGAWPAARERLRRRRRSPIKAALLDQSVVAGIGNIYADEALWASRVHPATPVASVTDRKLKELLTAAAAVMELSLSLGGSTDRNYVDAEGRRGAYLDFAKVFRRQGQPCPRCGQPIIKIRVAGRGTHLCPRCQRWRPNGIGGKGDKGGRRDKSARLETPPRR